MKEKKLKANSLASILILDKELGDEPEVWRSQKGVCFIVPFWEYLDFLRTSLSKVTFLGTDVQVLTNLLREVTSKSEEDYFKLFQCFLKDISYGVCKELYYSELDGKEATKIIHSADTGKVLGKRDILNYVQTIDKDIEALMLQSLVTKGYPLRKISEHNYDVYNYALFCFSCSMNNLTNSKIWSYTYE